MSRPEDIYKEAKSLLAKMPPCVDGNYQFACLSCQAAVIADWAARIYEQGREDVATATLATIATTLKGVSA
jgi:hypothetical protein